MTLSYYVGNLSSRGAKGEAKHQAKMPDKQFLINRALGPKRVAEKKRDTAYNKKQFMAKKMGVNSTPKDALKKAENGEKQHTGWTPSSTHRNVGRLISDINKERRMGRIKYEAKYGSWESKINSDPKLKKHVERERARIKKEYGK